MNAPFSLEQLEAVCSQTRRDIIRMVYEVESGHPGGSLGCVEYFVALYYRLLNHNPANFSLDGRNEDVFILSNGHISPVWYSVLARIGYFPVEELATFRRLNSRLQGHPAVAEGLPGIRVATGSLGQGFSVAVGAALTKRLNADPNLVYVLLGDGEIQEGQIWEAALFAAHHNVDNLIATIDLNYKQIDGDTRDIMNTAPVADKWKAFGWEVIEQKEGNHLSSVIETLEAAKGLTGKGKPVMILLETIMGFGVDFMHDNYKWHGSPPNKAQYEQAMAQLKETLGDY